MKCRLCGGKKLPKGHRSPIVLPPSNKTLIEIKRLGAEKMFCYVEKEYVPELAMKGLPPVGGPKWHPPVGRKKGGRPRR